MDEPAWMTNRPPENENDGHWEIYADAMDLTIEGHRLIAEEIVYEVKLLWRGAVTRLLDLFHASTRRRSTPRPDPVHVPPLGITRRTPV